MAKLSFGHTEGSFLQLNGQKHLRSAAEDLISNKQKRTKRIYQKRRRHRHYKTLKITLKNKQTNKYQNETIQILKGKYDTFKQWYSYCEIQKYHPCGKNFGVQI